MSLRTILAPISGGEASRGAADMSCALARRFGAHVEGLHVRQDPGSMVIDFNAGMPASPELFESLIAAANETAETARTAFMEAVTRHKLPWEKAPPALNGKFLHIEASAEWRDETAPTSFYLSHRARLFDLVVVGRSDRVTEQPHSDMLETLLLEGGRPMLIAPAKLSAPVGEKIVVAWNGSVEAARALTAANPFLGAASKIVILTTDPTDEVEGCHVVRQLGWHGIHAIARHVARPKGVDIGDHLLETAREENADLLVMGGYGRAPWREMLFGGATRDILSTSHLPILLAH